MPNGVGLPCTQSTRASVTTARHTKPVRHSSAAGINGKNERHRSAGVAYGYPRSHRRPSGSSAGRASALELDASTNDLCSSRMTIHVNKVHHVTTITQVAKDLGEDEDWLRDVANEMEIEDGVIWVYGVGEDGVQAFTDFGIENLIELVRMYKESPGLLKRWPSE
jgi:hypothetical protein